MKAWMLGLSALALAACAKKAEEAPPAEASEAAAAAAEVTPSERLDAVLATAAEDVKARYAQRHPKEMLEFYGVEPGMTVVEVLPGGGWWTKILIPYLGAGGRVVGADYSLPMWALFGEYSPDPEKQKTWATDWPAGTSGWCSGDCAPVSGAVYGSIPDSLKGTVDAVLMFRALHHFNRLEDDGGYLTAALKDTFDMLKPGGLVGVEQHRAPAGNSDAWADGENGYLKQDAVIAAFTKAGFVFEGSSEINANPKDQPTEKDFVWRLPPTYATSGDDAAKKAAMDAIGESDRMTLRFRKPLG